MGDISDGRCPQNNLKIQILDLRTGTLIWLYTIPPFEDVLSAIILVPFSLIDPLYHSSRLSSLLMNGYPKPLMMIRPLSLIMRHAALHNGLAGVGAGHDHTLIQSRVFCFSRDPFLI